MPLMRASAEALARNRSPSVADTEEGRAFLQARLAIFGFCIFVLAGGSWILLSILRLFVGASAHDPFSVAGATHVVGALLAGGLWLWTRRGSVAPNTLHALDLGMTLTISTISISGAGLLPDPVVAIFVALLSCITGTLARAIVVPSTARRTLFLGLISGAIVVGFAIYRNPSLRGAVTAAVPAACWCATGVVLATLASHTIFGLRREVQTARVLGQYTLETKIGEGGMGHVWRANHALLRRPTAVKLLPTERMGEQAILRFEREVQLTARLTHPNTVAIYDYGRTRDGVFYYAMELLDGTDLERLVATTGPQPAGRVVHILSQVCGALAEAHDLGLVHRDIKPANILLSLRKHEHEFAKVVDFGLVKTVSSDDGDSAVTAVNTLTGTPLYMAPESIQSPQLTEPRSDLYQLAAVGWFLLVGRPPFSGKSIVEICGHHLHTTPERPSQALGRELPADLEDILLACLAKRPEDRPLDARALRKQLETCSAAGSWSAEAAERWWQEHKPKLLEKPAATKGTQTVALDMRGRVPETAESREAPANLS